MKIFVSKLSRERSHQEINDVVIYVSCSMIADGWYGVVKGVLNEANSILVDRKG